MRVPTLLVSPWVSAGTVFRSPSPELKFDHTSLIATVLTWCGVSPGAAGLGDRVAVAPAFETVLDEHTRPDVPTFTVPDGYAEQGMDCWITNEAERLSAGVVRSLVAQSATIEELEAISGPSDGVVRPTNRAFDPG